MLPVSHDPAYIHRRKPRPPWAVVERDWVPIEEMSIHLPRAVRGGGGCEFLCLHWGFDHRRDPRKTSIAENGARRGGSTISQQTAKNTFLWHRHRSWLRKALEGPRARP